MHFEFLSCLFGSEQKGAEGEGDIKFLSCLFGSELFINKASRPCPFLSCLFGSELAKSAIANALEISELPIRQ